MLNCKIDVTNVSDSISFELVKEEFHRIYYDNHHLIYNRLLKHFLIMIENGLVTDSEGEKLDGNSEKVKEFLELEEVTNC